MCGRFTLHTEEKQIEERFQVSLDLPLSKQYNIAPTQQVLAITADEGERKAHFFRWGLVPFWAKDTKIGNKLINARAETLDEKPSFKHLLNRKRCFIVTDGFYEWRKEEDKKQPYYIRRKDKKPFAFAGLWDTWKQEEEKIQSCTIITTTPNKVMEPLHSRMPVILDEERESIWLDSNISDQAYLKSILIPYQEDDLQSFSVSLAVNNPRNNHESNIVQI